MEISVKEQLINLGMKEDEIDHHESDLYVLKNKISEKFVEGYEFKNSVTVFKDNIDHVLWYEIRFAYHER